MSKNEFLDKLRSIIVHNSWGYGELEIIIDEDNRKGIYYRHKDKTSSFGTYASSWEELAEKSINKLSKAKLI